MPYRNTDQQREYQKNWMKKRRDEWIAVNGPCRVCGSWEDPEIDHIDPSTKLCKPSELWSRKKEFREAELAKCQVLCYECHLRKTKAQFTTVKIHGTMTMYNGYGCRCKACKAVKAIRARVWKLGCSEATLKTLLP